jgi:hypothetical protein
MNYQGSSFSDPPEAAAMASVGSDTTPLFDSALQVNISTLSLISTISNVAHGTAVSVLYINARCGVELAAEFPLFVHNARK